MCLCLHKGIFMTLAHCNQTLNYIINSFYACFLFNLPAYPDIFHSIFFWVRFLFIYTMYPEIQTFFYFGVRLAFLYMLCCIFCLIIRQNVPRYFNFFLFWGTSTVCIYIMLYVLPDNSAKRTQIF